MKRLITVGGFTEAMEQAVSMDCFIPEFIDSEYTRGVTDLIMWAFTRGPDEDSHLRCAQVRQIGKKMTEDTNA